MPSVRAGKIARAGAAVVLIAAAVLVARWRFSGDKARAANVPREEPHSGYVGAQACRECHREEHASWHGSYHRTMTQVPKGDNVRGRFEGAGPLPVKGGHLELERRGDDHFFTLVTADGTRKRQPVTLMTGSHHMQVYWLPGEAGNTQVMAPYVYLFEAQRWVPMQDTMLADPKIEWNFDRWNHRCLQCHTTAGQPRPTGQGEAMDTRVANLGIACEACHGPGESHVTFHGENRTPRGRREDPDPTIVNPARLPHDRSVDACAQCHGVVAIRDFPRFLEHGFAFRPGQALASTRVPMIPGTAAAAPYFDELERQDPGYYRNHFWPDGTARPTGRESTALVRSACFERGPITCLSCHSMHDYKDPDDQLSRAGREDEACLQCHTSLRAEPTAHTHHAAGSPGSRCYNCHMPHTSFGMLKAVRSHRIDSPRVVTVASERPNACNLCHLDQTLAWTAEHLERWYGRSSPALAEEEARYSAAAMWALRGDAVQRALVAWSMGWPPARQASGEDWVAAYLLLALGDSYSAVRYVAQRSLRALPGFAGLDYDYIGGPETIDAQMLKAIERWGPLRRPVAPDKAERVFMRPDGVLDTAAVTAQTSRRDETRIVLQE